MRKMIPRAMTGGFPILERKRIQCIDTFQLVSDCVSFPGAALDFLFYIFNFPCFLIFLHSCSVFRRSLQRIADGTD